MPSGYLQRVQAEFDHQAQIRNDIHVVSTNYFVNRCPLVCRTPRVPVGSTTFTMAKRTFRSRVGTLAVRVLASDASLLLVDASAFIGGDVLELSSGERVEVLEDPGLNSNRLYVRRGVESTTIGTASANETVYLISNPAVSSAPKDGEATRPIGVAPREVPPVGLDGRRAPYPRAGETDEPPRREGRAGQANPQCLPDGLHECPVDGRNPSRRR